MWSLFHPSMSCVVFFEYVVIFHSNSNNWWLVETESSKATTSGVETESEVVKILPQGEAVPVPPGTTSLVPGTHPHTHTYIGFVFNDQPSFSGVNTDFRESCCGSLSDFLQSGCHSYCPSNSIQALEEKYLLHIVY